jgi:general secretion pathway protein M
MIQSRLPRGPVLRQLLALAGYAAAIVVLLATAFTAVAGVFEQRQAVATASDLLAQLEGRRTAGNTRGDTPSGPVPTGSPFIEGQTLTVAGAALLQRVGDAVAKVGGNVLSSQVDVQGVQAKDGYVSVLASCELEQAAMQRLLYDLEAGIPYLFIEQFVAQAPQTAQGQPGGRMRILLSIAGRWDGGK